jgi:hypothetical protein
VRDAFGPDARTVEVAPLSGGGFASVTRVDLADGRSVVLKVGPLSGTGILDYEQGVVGAEARYLQMVERNLWDGNVLCAADSNGRWGLTGLVDGERFLFGDPLVDFVSPAMFRRIEEEPTHPFVLGYAAVSGRPATFTESERRRLELYRLHLYLLMTVEMPSRGMTRDNQAWRFDRLEALLRECVDVIESWDAC